ncbi:RHS repeat-associated core domain-containing protein [Stenotrophomonas sp. 22385]|jgi:RHS repeat-associated protein|uniref:RHS repeat domain-containing protein n=1 Tax=Stenotrophomonas sp. 22385 TaxID=3453915 RepID=UPI003F86F639
MEALIRLMFAAIISLAFCASTFAQETVEYIHTDALGSPVAITDQAGNVIGRATYQPFGETVEKIQNDMPGYAGHVSDSITGFSYMQQRYYDSALGRFLSSDPVTPLQRSGGAFNRYSYAANNPYTFNDPDGRQERAAERHSDSVASDPSAYDAFGPAAIAVTTVIVRATPVVGPAMASALASSVDSAQPKGPSPVAPAPSVSPAPATPAVPTPAPNFVVSSNGTAFPVPAGSTGPTPVINPSGKQTGVAFTGGKGGENGQVSTMRIMDPTPAKGNSPGYPGGYIKYENAGKQGVDPLSGKTLPNSKSHFPIK